jgi:hypothetical protein
MCRCPTWASPMWSGSTGETMEYTITFKVVMTKKVSQADLEDALIHMVLD